MNSVWDFLKGYEYWEVLNLLLIGFVLFMSYCLIAKPRFKWHNFEFVFFSGKSNGNLALIANRSRIERKIYYIEFIGMTKAQMKRVDSALLEIKSLLTSNYGKLLKEEMSDEEEPTAHRDYLDYGAHVEVMLNIEIRNHIREMILDQKMYIPEIATRDFDNFAQDSARAWYDCGKKYMDLWYVSKGRLINRERLRLSVLQLMPDFEKYSRDLIRDIKNIETDMNKKIDEYRQEIQEEENRFLGIRS